jgi:hypothetical protein
MREKLKGDCPQPQAEIGEERRIDDDQACRYCDFGVVGLSAKK